MPRKSTKNLEPLPSMEPWLPRLIPFACALLIALRFLLPTEATAQGETLIVTQLWFGVLLLWVLNFWKSGETGVRWDVTDIAVGGLVLTQVISALLVVFTEGDRRAALNFLWEWISLAALFFVLKQSLTTPEQARKFLLQLVLFTAVLGGFGLWQHYVWFPAESSRYSLLRTELDELESTEDPSYNQLQRKRELVKEFAELGIPTEGGGRLLWEQRLQNSSEPFGPFALANTFAGLLLFFALLALGWAVSEWQAGGVSKSLTVPILCVAFLLFCLLLTKSRTAIVGLMAGFTVWGWSIFQQKKRMPLRIVGSIAGVLVLGVGMAALSGGFDLQVITESSKSLRYRVQYWVGSWEIVKEHPVWGVGPGNFRQHYLSHKLPESSEEIADPHNMVFDVWTSTGTLGLLALLGCIIAGWWLFRHVQRRVPQSGSTSETLSRTEPTSSLLLFNRWSLGFCAAFFCLVLWELVIGQIDFRNGIMLVAFLGGLSLLRKFPPTAPLSLVSLIAGCVALCVHLLGAGGIAMPAITQLFLIALAVAASYSSPRVLSSRVITRGIWPAGILAVGLFLGCLLTATLPVMNAAGELNAGDYALNVSPIQAQRHYEAAATADPLASSPWERLAELSLQQWQSSPKDSPVAEAQFTRGINFWNEAVARDPESHHGYRRLAHWYWKKSQRMDAKEDAAANDATKAADYLTQALTHYPHSVTLQWEQTRALQAAGKHQAALAQAKLTRAQHDLNKAEGHTDKLLDEEQRRLLADILTK